MPLIVWNRIKTGYCGPHWSVRIYVWTSLRFASISLRATEFCKSKIIYQDFGFFFFNDRYWYIDVRRRYTGKVHPLKSWVGPSIVKRRRGECYGLGRTWRCLWMRVLNSWRLYYLTNIWEHYFEHTLYPRLSGLMLGIDQKIWCRGTETYKISKKVMTALNLLLLLIPMINTGKFISRF